MPENDWLSGCFEEIELGFVEREATLVTFQTSRENAV